MKDGGSAFPVPGITLPDLSGRSRESEVGMSLRDYFAAAAMKGMMKIFEEAGRARGEPFSALECAAVCYVYADAMLAERGK